MKDREMVMNSDKKRQWDEDEKELKKLEKINQNENSNLIQKKEKFYANKQDLFKQMEEK
jgi:hypothetical protein